MDGDITPKLTAVIENNEEIKRFVSFSKPSTLVGSVGIYGTYKISILALTLTDLRFAATNLVHWRVILLFAATNRVHPADQVERTAVKALKIRGA